MAENAVAQRGTSIAAACQAFGVSETCYRYGPKLRAENEEIADLPVGLTLRRCKKHSPNPQVLRASVSPTSRSAITSFSARNFGP